MKTGKGTILCFMSILLAIVALGCGNAIEGATNGWAMLGYTFLALAVFKRIPHHTNEWRDAQ